MTKRFGTVALECLFDLGIAIVYAVAAGILIVALVVSDGPISVLRAGLYAAALPAGVVLLISAEIGLRLTKEWRSRRRVGTFPS